MTQINIGDSRVVESREVSDGVTIRRRRETPDGKRFTTYERIEKPNLAVIKKSGVRTLFDRDKLSIAIKRSVGKFFDSEVEVEEIINKIEDGLYALGENEITSKQIGDKVLDELAFRNEVAYVRFASVYQDFIYKDQTDYARQVLDYLRDFQRQTGHELEVMDPESLAGIDFCRTYDIMAMPTMIALSDDGALQNTWSGLPLPTISEVSYYVQ